MRTNHGLTVPILDALSNLTLKPDLLSEVNNSFSPQKFRKANQGGHGTGKTGNLAVNFSRQEKHREFSKFFYTGKMVPTQGKFRIF